MALFDRNGSNGRNEAAMRHMRLDDQPNSSPPPWSYYRRLLISRERRAVADSARKQPTFAPSGLCCAWPSFWSHRWVFRNTGR